MAGRLSALHCETGIPRNNPGSTATHAAVEGRDQRARLARGLRARRLMLTIIVAGRNDDYGKDFRARLFRSVLHNCDLLNTAAIEFEYILAEWNPLSDRPPLSEEFVARVPNARALIIPSEIHEKYSLNPEMPFHEMPAKNAALRRASGEVVIVTNADILFSEKLVERIARGSFSDDTLYRAHRIDVKSELSWQQIQDPANQLPSGEG